jgi:hypothetical protein
MPQRPTPCCPFVTSLCPDAQVPTLNLIGTHDEFFGPPAHGTFLGSCAAQISAQADGWGKKSVTGNAYQSMLEQGIRAGLVATFPGAQHDITTTHNHGVRDVLLDFLHRYAQLVHGHVMIGAQL